MMIDSSIISYLDQIHQLIFQANSNNLNFCLNPFSLDTN